MLEAYADPARGYHDLEHLREVLERVDELAAAEGVPDELEVVRLAAFFHDVVYRTAPDAITSNEEASAQWAQEALAGLLPEPAIERVAELVRATYDHRAASADRAAGMLMDADLAILAAGPQRYERYLAGVRQEYAQVRDEDFRAGRSAVLRDLVDREHLFHTAYARRHWEAPARANVAAELGE